MIENRLSFLGRPGIAGSIFAVFTSQVAILALAFLSRIVLARLLVPADFGLFALALFVLAVTHSLRDFGLSSHLIREDDGLVGNALLLQAGASLILGGGLVVFRSFFSALNPGVPALLPALSLTLFSEAFSTVFLAILRKRLFLQRAVLSELLSFGLFVLSSICLAFFGWGVWSLVVAHVLASYAKALFLSFPVRALVTFTFTLSHTRRLIRKSTYFFLIGIVGLLLLDLDKAILGLFLPAQQVGYYVMAFSFIYLPCRLIETPLHKIAYPAFVEAAGNRERLHDTYRNFTLISLALELPLYLFIVVNAEAIIALLYGAEWLPIVPLVVWMAFLPLVDPFSKFGNDLLQALGKESIQYYASLPYLLFFASAAYLLTEQRGVWGVILANYLQIGGWAITYFYLRAVGGAGRLFRDVMFIYGLPGASFFLVFKLIAPSKMGSLLVSALLLVVLWPTLLIYVRLGGLTLPRLVPRRVFLPGGDRR